MGKIFGSVAGGLGSLLLIVIVYGVINLVLVGGQEIIHHGDKVNLDKIEAELNNQKKDIERMELEIKAKLNFLDMTKKQIDSTTNVVEHNRLVDKYNLELPSYNSLNKQYSQKIDEYNMKVNEANNLSKEIGSTWYVVPIHGKK